MSAHGEPESTEASRPRWRAPLWLPLFLGRTAIAIGALMAWQFLPQIQTLSNLSSVFDPYFVSSPERVAEQLVDLVLERGEADHEMWSALGQTLQSTLLGVVIGVALGALSGLVLSNSRRLRRLLWPFILMANATPRIALIPIIIIIAGPTLTTNVVVAVMIVFFITFFNALAGGRSVPVQVVQNARLLGASPMDVMWLVRLRYVGVWTIASLPNAISFGLLATVTAELLTGRVGTGRILNQSIFLADSTLTFAMVVILAIVGMILVMGAERVTRRLLHWWDHDTAVT